MPEVVAQDDTFTFELNHASFSHNFCTDYASFSLILVTQFYPSRTDGFTHLVRYMIPKRAI